MKKNYILLTAQRPNRASQWCQAKKLIKLYLFCLLFLLTSFANAQDVVAIPDANFKAYLVGNTNINTNNDGEIQVAEAEAFTGTIDCSSRSITDLTGIEAFVNITELNCRNNQLTNLDIAQNTELQVLICEANQLTNLDVSQNTALTELRCGSNQLTDLDVSQNTALQILLCHNNQLTRLNVKNGNNTILKHMQAQNNTTLSCIQVDNVDDAVANEANLFWQRGNTNNAAFNTDCNAVLPVSLLTFTAKAEGNYGKLQWQTSSEVNNKGFEIYRSGNDGIFVKLGEIKNGSNNSSSQQPSTFYVFTDKQPLNGTNYYKLTQLDNDGKENELGVRTLNFSLSASSLQLYPNPTLNEVTLRWNDDVVTAVKLIDLNGKVLQVIKPQMSSRNITVPLLNYPIGTYFFRVEFKDRAESLKVVKL